MQPRSLGFLAQAQLLLLHLAPSLGLRMRVGNITKHPSVVVAGIGDSGTTAVIKALVQVGLAQCSDRDEFGESQWSHKNRKRHIQGMLNASKGKLSVEAFRRAAEWKETTEWLNVSATWDRKCLELERKKKHLPIQGGATEDLKWGFKEPHFAWLLPAMDVAYHNKTRYLLVARDPRDICSNHCQDQFRDYGRDVMNISDCYVWWATFWSQLLETYENESRFAIVRIEDLVLPDPSESTETMGCVVRYIGMQTNWTKLQRAVSAMRVRNEATLIRHRSLESAVSLAEDKSHVSTFEADPQNVFRSTVENAMRKFHNHSGSYMGHHYNFTEEERQLLVANASNSPPIVHQTMRRLGYDPKGFGLLKPTTPACLCRSA